MENFCLTPTLNSADGQGMLFQNALIVQQCQCLLRELQMDSLTVNSGQLTETVIGPVTVVHVTGKPGSVITAHSPVGTPTATINHHILMVKMNMLTASSGQLMEIVTLEQTVAPVTGRNGWLHIAKHLAHNLLTTHLI